MSDSLPHVFTGEVSLLALLAGGALVVVSVVAVILWIGPRLVGSSNLKSLTAGKERLDAEGSIRDTLIKAFGIFGSIVAGTAIAFSYVDKVNTQNEAASAQAYFDTLKNLQAASSEEQKAMAIASVAAIARSSRNLTPMAMDLFSTYIRSFHKYQSGEHHLDGLPIAAVADECRNIRAKFPSADVEVIVNSMSSRRPDYDRTDREWNLSGLDLHSAFFARGFTAPAGSILFTGSNLAGVGFAAGLDLSAAHFEYADLSCATFGEKANLSNARFLHADLRGAVLASVTLSGADLTDADLRATDLTGVSFANANVHNVKACTRLDAAVFRDSVNQKSMILEDCY